MKIGFFAFTGTGNTLRVCKILAKELEQNEIVCDIKLIKQVADLQVINDYDKIIIAYPVHGFNTPMPMLDFIKSLPNSTNKKCVYIVRVSGEPLSINHAASIVPKRILKSKGYKVMGEFAYVMPYNIIFRHTDNMAARMKNAAILKAKKDVQIILNNDVKLFKNNMFNRLVSFICKIEHPAMPMFGKHYKVTDLCSSCGVCEKVCPVSNITLKDGKPVFGKHCVGCMGCSFHCPHDAIRIAMLDGWRVNGAYNFNTTPATDDEVCNYCKKSYLKYFHDSEDTACDKK